MPECFPGMQRQWTFAVLSCLLAMGLYNYANSWKSMVFFGILPFSLLKIYLLESAEEEPSMEDVETEDEMSEEQEDDHVENEVKYDSDASEAVGRDSSVKSVKLENGDPAYMAIGKRCYKVLAVPKILTIKQSTYRSYRKQKLSEEKAMAVFGKENAIYLQCASTGEYLAANLEVNELYLSKNYDAHCQFYPIRGNKLVHKRWAPIGLLHRGERKAKFVGQSMTHKLVVSAKRLQAWEEMLFIKQTESDEHASSSKPVFSILLHATRFKKGLWIGFGQNEKGSLVLVKSSTDAICFNYGLCSGVNESTGRQVAGDPLTSTMLEKLVDIPWELTPAFLQTEEKDFSLVHETTLDISVAEFCRIFLHDCGFLMNWHQDAGNENVCTSEWQEATAFVGLPEGYVRKHEFKIPLPPIIPGVSCSNIQEYQWYNLNDDRSQLTFKNKTYSLDVPYGTYFTVETMYQIHSIDDATCKLRFLCGVHFTKYTIFKSQIKKGSIIGTRMSCKKMLEMLEKEIKARKDKKTVGIPWTPTSSNNFFESKDDDFTKVLSEKLSGCTVSTFFDTCLADNSEMFLQHHENQGATKVDIGDWKFSKSLNLHIRKQTFSTPVHVPGISNAMVDEYQFYEFDEQKEKLTFGSKTFTKDAPYGDYFTVESKQEWKNDGNVSCFVAIVFEKSTLLKSKISSSALKATEQNMADFIALAKEFVDKKKK